MEFKIDKDLTVLLSYAIDSFAKDDINTFNDVIKECITRADYLMKTSKNPAKTALTIEYSCLLFDKSISAPNCYDKINSRLDGCINALNDLDTLQNNPSKYIKDFKMGRTDIDSSTIFTKELKTNHLYLSNTINTPLTSAKFPSKFYEKRRDCLSIARNEYIKQRKLLLKPYIQEKTQSKSKDRGLER